MGNAARQGCDRGGRAAPTSPATVPRSVPVARTDIGTGATAGGWARANSQAQATAVGHDGAMAKIPDSTHTSLRQ